VGADTKIEWATHTFNPVVGCTKVSAGCDHCYAEGWANRTGQRALWAGERRRTSQANWLAPFKWDRAARDAGERHRVFCASLADVFDNQWNPDWRADLWSLIKQTDALDWLLLTKRPQNIAEMLPWDWGDGWGNVWLGATAENQEEADRRIPLLLSVPARIHFLSYEPALGPIDLHYGNWIPPRGGGPRANLSRPWETPGPTLDWVIAGGESGPKARPAHPDWFRAVRDQCAAAGVPFFFKQHGEFMHETQVGASIGYAEAMRKKLHCWPDGTGSLRVGKKRAGRLLDGREHNEFPATTAHLETGA
jgi:protein gp37